MLSRLSVPTQGSPKAALVAGTLQLARFKHAPSTTLRELLALQLELTNAPQLPVGVP